MLSYPYCVSFNGNTSQNYSVYHKVHADIDTTLSSYLHLPVLLAFACARVRV